MGIKDPTFLLRSSLLFRDLSAQEMEAIKAITTTHTLKKGALLFREGERARGFFILASGMVKIFRIASNGREPIIHFVEAGDSFAEATIFNPTYPAHAEALAECVVLRVEREPLLQLMTKHPQLSFRVMGAMEKWIRRLCARISELSISEVPARLACYILSLPLSASVKRFDGKTALTITITKTALAQMLGTTKETLSRVIRKLREKRIVDFTGKWLVILNREKLEKLAAGDLRLH